ncbi:MAG TPA: alpha/beta hydrolase [Stellaceae bacterium]|jgi:pimeloyl-ACP methyl ester carboxylesterase|nr:alpha/beta hydrolase [Stellaceae bacterium]
MRLTVNGIDSFVATGGRDFDAALPAVVLIHGGGMDHSVWALHSRWFAHHGYAVLAPDLPGHGRSGGTPLTTIADMANWIAALIAASGVAGAWLIGHSMGSLVALETASRHPARVSALSLIGTAAPMTVGAELLKAAEANEHKSVDMVSLWGLGVTATLGGCLAPGLWMLGGAQRVLEASRPGVLFADLSACNNYKDGLEAASRISVPVTVIIGGHDLMTPLRAGRALAAALSDARIVVLRDAGHLMMAERPDDVLAALRGQEIYSLSHWKNRLVRRGRGL